MTQRPEVGDILLLTSVTGDYLGDAFAYLVGRVGVVVVTHYGVRPFWDVKLSFVCPCELEGQDTKELYYHSLTVAPTLGLGADFKVEDGTLTRSFYGVSYVVLGTIWDGVDRCRCGNKKTDLT